MIVAVLGPPEVAAVATALAFEYQRRRGSVLLVDSTPDAVAREWLETSVPLDMPMPSVVGMGESLHAPGQLDALAAVHDITILHAPYGDGPLARAALAVCDLAVVPCDPSSQAARALVSSPSHLHEALVKRPSLHACILLALFAPETSTTKPFRAAVATRGLPVLRTELRHLNGSWSLDILAPSGRAAVEVAELAEELLAFPGVHSYTTDELRQFAGSDS